MKKNRIMSQCKVCGGGFEIRPCEAKAIVTCSKECSLKHRANNTKNRVVTWGDKLAAAHAERRKAGIKKDTSYITDEYREKLRAAALRNGLGKANLGKKLTEEHKKKMSISKIGHNNHGWKMSPEVCKKRSERSRKGADSNLWKGGVTSGNAAIRSSFEYKEWRRKVFLRDDYTCQTCGAKGVEIHADHIKPFAYYKELRFDVNNGRTLCVPCHKSTPTYLSGAQKMKALLGIDIRET